MGMGNADDQNQVITARVFAAGGCVNAPALESNETTTKRPDLPVCVYRVVIDENADGHCMP